MKAEGEHPTVLRRRSWPGFAWVTLPLLGVGFAAAVIRVTSTHGFRQGWQGIPVYLALCAVLGRITSSKVCLFADRLVIVNPLRTYTVPRELVGSVLANDGGTLIVRTTESREIAVFGFGGSVVDHFIGTTREAEKRMNDWIQKTDHPDRAQGPKSPQFREAWTRCPWPDTAAYLALACVAAGTVAGLAT